MLCWNLNIQLQGQRVKVTDMLHFLSEHYELLRTDEPESDYLDDCYLYHSSQKLTWQIFLNSVQHIRTAAGWITPDCSTITDSTCMSSYTFKICRTHLPLATDKELTKEWVELYLHSPTPSSCAQRQHYLYVLQTLCLSRWSGGLRRGSAAVPPGRMDVSCQYSDTSANEWPC